MPLTTMLLSVLQSWSLRYALNRILSFLFSWWMSPRMLSPTWVPNRYPPTRRSDHVDVYQSSSGGEVAVPDPYQWLETYSDETDKWTSDQEAFTRDYLDRNPDLEQLRTAFRDCIDYPKFTAPHLYHDGRWYWYYDSGLDSQMAIYRSPDRTLPDFSKMNESAFELFFDPNALSSDGTASLTIYEMSKCGIYFAYAVSQSGSDCMTVYIRYTDSPFTKGMDHDNDPGRLPEEIKFVKFSGIEWSPDSSGFFYQRFPEPGSRSPGVDGISMESDLDAMICYHRLGTHQSEDIIVHKDDEHRNWFYTIEVSRDGKYLILTTAKDSSRVQNFMWVSEFDVEKIGPNIKWTKLINEFNAAYHFITNIGSTLYIRTNLLAPTYKIVTLNLDKPAFRDLIPMTDANLSAAILVASDKLVVTYRRNVIDEIYIFSLSGEMIGRVAEDSVGAADASGREELPWLFIEIRGFTSPVTIGLYDFSAPDHKRWSIYRTTVLNGLNPDEFEATQVWYTSRDGTRIPMFLVRHKSTKFDGTAPVLQFGFGGFNLSVVPFFNPTNLTFLKNYGVIYAVPNIRGGGEFGEDWHLAGCREKKFNCFDDFIAATDYLVKNKHADPNKVAIMGRSNGGLLVAACVNRAPEGTFGCAVAEVGVLDMLKFHKFTIGSAWTGDYGHPENPNDFDFIYPISPIQNVSKGTVLPPYLLMTADHDDRVVPMHSFKMAATLQHTAPHNPHPLLLRVEKKAGHRLGRSTQQQIFEDADKYGFIVQSLGLQLKAKPSCHL